MNIYDMFGTNKLSNVSTGGQPVYPPPQQQAYPPPQHAYGRPPPQPHPGYHGQGHHGGYRGNQPQTVVINQGGGGQRGSDGRDFATGN